MPARAPAPRHGLGGTHGIALVLRAAMGVALVLLAAMALPLGAQGTPAARSQTSDASLESLIDRLRDDPLGVDLPPLDSIVRGSYTVAGTERLPGPFAVSGGTLEVLGTIDGDAVAIDGDIVVRAGGLVRGDALAVGGRVRLEGGLVEGEMRSLSGVAAAPGAAADAGAPVSTTRRAISLVLGWLMMLALIGIGVLMFAGTHLQAVEEALERRFARSFWTGVLGQLAIAPVLLLLLVALALTLIGILLIPFAVVAYIIALCGLLMLGFLAVARFTGRAFSGSRPLPGRRLNLRALLIGISIYVGLWLLAAAFTWNPMAGAVLRAVALAGSWVALTLGLGATLITRAGTRRDGERQRAAAPAADMSWQTPTPVTGVVAARRPVVASRERG